MVTIKIKFRKSSVEDREGVLVIRLIHKRLVRNITTEYKLYEDEWDDDCESVCLNSLSTRRKHYLIDLQNSIIEDVSKLKKMLIKEVCKKDFDLVSFANLYKGKKSKTDFLSWMRQTIDNLNENRQFKTAKAYKSCMKSFGDFCKDDIFLEQIDSTLIHTYQKYLISKNVCLNTVSFYMRILRAVYNKAIEEGLTNQKHPFTSVYTGIAKTEKRAVDHYVIYKLKNACLDNYFRFEFTKDLFLLSFYLRGIAFVDLANLKQANIEKDSIRYIRSKTKQELLIKLEPCAKKIIKRYKNPNSDYLLPILRQENDINNYENALRLYNKNLKDLSLHLGLNTILSSYVARHTWATLAKRKGIDLVTISEALGHSSLQTTQIYLDSLDQERIDRANSLVIQMVG